MNAVAGFTTVTPLTLQRSCFTSEQDRLNEYAKALRVPVQTGEVIKGDKGDTGGGGERGSPGARGASGVDGATPAMTSSTISIGNGVAFVVAPGDIRSKIVNLFYEDVAADPVTIIGILCLRFDGTNTVCHLTAATPDALYRVRITTYT